MGNKEIKIIPGLDLNRLPKHLGIIMDGNGRWATAKGLPRSAGHKAGIENLRKMSVFASELGLSYMTIFTLSTENLKRPKDEVDNLFNLIRTYMNEDTKQLVERDIRLNVIGAYKDLPGDVASAIDRAMADTRHCGGLTLTLAVNYGGRADIIRAVNTAVKSGTEVTEESFKDLLYTKGMPDLDLVIRTSGEQRISNFLIYQLAYAEFYFIKKHWPSFNKKDFQEALLAFQQRNRRFGGVKS